jgi:hypothetical protein
LCFIAEKSSEIHRQGFFLDSPSKGCEGTQKRKDSTELDATESKDTYSIARQRGTATAESFSEKTK